MLSVRDQVRRRQPVERPLDIIGLELLVTASQALLAGILLSLAAQLGGDARAYGLPIPGLLAVLAIAVGVGWLRWLVGGSGLVMASVGLATAILTGALWLLALQDASLPRIDWLVGLLAAACALYGLVAGVFLDGPHRAHWKGGLSQPRRGVPQTRATPARFSPPVQRVVDERLTNVRLPQVSLPSAARLKAVSIPRPTRASEPPTASSGDGLSVAAAVTPLPSASTPPASSGSEDGLTELAAPAAALGAPIPTDSPPSPVPVPVVEPPPAPTDATSLVPAPAEASTAGEPGALIGAPADVETTPVDTETTPVEVETALTVPATASADAGTPSADPDAPTQPTARAATEWPRAIEPRGARPRPEGGDETRG